MERLKSRKLIDRVFREGKSVSFFPFRISWLRLDKKSIAKPGGAERTPAASGPAPMAEETEELLLQAAFGVSSRNFKKATDRNRIKRLSREAYRLQKQELAMILREREYGLVLFILYTGKELPDYRLVYDRIGVALQRLAKEAGL